MKFKSIISMLLVCSMLILTVSAASFPDVTERHSWAKEAIDSMAEKGILKGFPEGDFKPDNAITKLDSLIIASRVLGYSDPENIDYIDAAYEKYEKDLELYNIDYKREVAYLLYKNAFTVSELPTYISETNKAKELRRYEAAIILTKIMGGEADIDSYSVDFLTYDDVSSIPANAIPYVAFVTENGIMNGMSETEFAPAGSVTRAMMSTMMYRALNKMNVTATEAEITSTSPSTAEITVKYDDGDTEVIAVPDFAIIKLDAADSNIAFLSTGLKVRLTYYNGQLSFIEGLASDLTLTTSGIIKTTSTSNGIKMLSIYRVGDEEQELMTYPLAKNCMFLVNGKDAEYSDMRAGTYVTLTVKGGNVSKIVAETSSATYSGTITNISLGEDAIITIEKKDGTTDSYILSENVTIRRNGNVSEPIDLVAGDSASIDVSQGFVTSITATSNVKTVSGTIEEIVISSTPSVTIKQGGTPKTYSVTSNTTFDVDGQSSTIYDLRLGASATLTLDGNNIKKISTAALVVSNVLVGKVTYVHPTSNVMGIEVTNADGTIEQIQAVVKSTVSIVDVTSTKITQFKKLTAGRYVVVTGSVNYGVFEVSTITITE